MFLCFFLLTFLFKGYFYESFAGFSSPQSSDFHLASAPASRCTSSCTISVGPHSSAPGSPGVSYFCLFLRSWIFEIHLVWPGPYFLVYFRTFTPYPLLTVHFMATSLGLAAPVEFLSSVYFSFASQDALSAPLLLWGGSRRPGDSSAVWATMCPHISWAAQSGLLFGVQPKYFRKCPWVINQWLPASGVCSLESADWG